MTSDATSTTVDTDTVTQQVHNLIEVNRDAAKGFEQAAEAMENPANKAIFADFGRQRATFASELLTAAAPYGVADTDGTVAAAAHRAWISVKDSFTDDDHAILSAAETGEDHAVETYEAAMEADLPQDLRSVIERQAAEVKAAHDRVRAMRDATE